MFNFKSNEKKIKGGQSQDDCNHSGEKEGVKMIMIGQ